MQKFNKYKIIYMNPFEHIKLNDIEIYFHGWGYEDFDSAPRRP